MNNNKTWIWVLIIAIVLIGGIAWAMSQNTRSDDMNHNDMDMTGSEQTTNTPSAPSTTSGGNTSSGNSGVSANVGVSAGASTGSVKSFTVNGNNFAFAPAKLSVKKGDTVRITFKNTGGFHDLVIDEFKVATAKLSGNQEETIEFVADKAGSFEYYCSVGNHRQMGMKGTLTVAE